MQISSRNEKETIHMPNSGYTYKFIHLDKNLQGGSIKEKFAKKNTSGRETKPTTRII